METLPSTLLEALEGQAGAPVIGPYGEMLTVEMLPARDTRWTARRKAEVVAAVRGGALGIELACRWYNISRQEFESWDRALDTAGLRALKVTKLQKYREVYAVC